MSSGVTLPAKGEHVKFDTMITPKLRKLRFHEVTPAEFHEARAAAETAHDERYAEFAEFSELRASDFSSPVCATCHGTNVGPVNAHGPFPASTQTVEFVLVNRPCPDC